MNKKDNKIISQKLVDTSSEFQNTDIFFPPCKECGNELLGFERTETGMNGRWEGLCLACRAKKVGCISCGSRESMMEGKW
jgi:hypothetical protein